MKKQIFRNVNAIVVEGTPQLKYAKSLGIVWPGLIGQFFRPLPLGRDQS